MTTDEGPEAPSFEEMVRTNGPTALGAAKQYVCTPKRCYQPSSSRTLLRMLHSAMPHGSLLLCGWVCWLNVQLETWGMPLVWLLFLRLHQ